MSRKPYTDAIIVSSQAAIHMLSLMLMRKSEFHAGQCDSSECYEDG